jgi:hypothetical protein
VKTQREKKAIADQIDNLATRGIDSECYFALVDLVCLWCDPTTSEWLQAPDFVEFEPTSVAYICPSFCDELFFKCFNDLGSFPSPSPPSETENTNYNASCHNLDADSSNGDNDDGDDGDSDYDDFYLKQI